MVTIVIKEDRKTARQIFSQARETLDAIGATLNIEPLQGSSPVLIIAWEHWNTAYMLAEIRAEDMNVENWVFNHESLKACKRIISLCLTAYAKTSR